MNPPGSGRGRGREGGRGWRGAGGSRGGGGGGRAGQRPGPGHYGRGRPGGSVDGNGAALNRGGWSGAHAQRPPPGLAEARPHSTAQPPSLKRRRSRLDDTPAAEDIPPVDAVLQIPGYYYDAVKKKYFSITANRNRGGGGGGGSGTYSVATLKEREREAEREAERVAIEERRRKEVGSRGDFRCGFPAPDTVSVPPPGLCLFST
ncbi:hypothetical protein BDK51DRAFT_43346 [Blyttiomyces helicus]|uniref:Uncharacterized protein n=1 Tax=Blyttiomyces helicus TaxID=388810 RepID=A0A4P9VUA3_9FUNG|nr:hypothetical protein BDK51DRAFT_43346 [Blyttiomyces helicus]|eukprot:RKO83161.1 hypothetical protein BDK51DRAFT_43346 [Blyttiomyces helicus]